MSSSEESLGPESGAGVEMQVTPAIRFPIVGLGASAGGLAAFEAFFSGMPEGESTGMAFVLVQHLAPDHESLLSNLVRRYTPMQVYEVEEGMRVRPNCVYIIPPNRDMVLHQGVLQLLTPSEPRGHRLPIDTFFRSLADDQRERSIGIILSGTGSDGTLGVRAIKGEGGMVMAQTCGTTEFDGMPRSALSTGLVDLELPPSQMARQLVAYASHAFGELPRDSSTPTVMASTVEEIVALLRSRTGHDFLQYKANTIRRRIERRVAVHGLDSTEHYLEVLRRIPGEVEALFRDLLIGVTQFFRDPETFQALEARVLPELFASKSAGGVIRVWSVGCSTGEEAYSLAILLAEHQEALKRSFKVQVFATDVDSQAIAAARAGLFPVSIAADLSAERLERFFSIERGGDGSPVAYRVSKGIRDSIIFSEQSVSRDPPFSRLDLIVCRNLLIYMNSILQAKLIPLFHYALNPGGFLFLGSSETVGDFHDLFGVLDRKLKLYQRQDSPLTPSRPFNSRFMPARITLDTLLRQPPRPSEPGKLDLREVTERTLLARLTVAAVLVDARGDILYLHGRSGQYLELVPGESDVNNILKMAREGLHQALTTALYNAGATKEAVRCAGLRVKTNGDFTTVDLTVCPVTLPSSATLFLVVLEASSPPTVQPTLAVAAVSPESGDEARVESLLRELRDKEEYIQTTREELETSNEELRSALEEMQSVNEELQSTNEELETSKEEVQSVNEELATVNTELQTKIVDLSRANDDMNNLLAGTGVGTIFVDHRLCISRFTPAAAQVVNLIPTDLGRPVGHIVSNLYNYDRMVDDVQQVLDTLVPVEIEVKSKAGAWYLMRIRPYRTLENVIQGAVIAFIDITKRKLAEVALSNAQELARTIVAAMRDPLVLLDGGLRVVVANDAFYRCFEQPRGEAEGVVLYKVLSQWDVPELRTLLETVLPQQAAFEGFEVPFPGSGGQPPHTLRLSARRARGLGEEEWILLLIEGFKEPVPNLN